MTLVLTIAASGLAEAQSHLTIALWIWIVSVAALVYGIHRVFRTLGAIEQVTITSQEATEKLPEAVKTALKELEEEKRPILQIEFEDKQPPFKVKAESEISFVFQLKLTRGDVARNTRVFFFAPPGFQFLDSPPGPVGVAEYKKCVSTEFNFGDIVRPMIPRNKVKLKTPPTPNTYAASYGIVCEGYTSGYNNFEIVVRGKGNVIK